MRVPYVVDNEQHRLADVLNEVLAGLRVNPAQRGYGRQTRATRDRRIVESCVASGNA